MAHKQRKSKGGIGLVKDHEQLKRKLEELQIQNTSFALCLSALIHNHGNFNPADEENEFDTSEYVFRITDFQSITGTELLIETKGDIDGEAGTLAVVVFPKKTEEVVSGQET